MVVPLLVSRAGARRLRLASRAGSAARCLYREATSHVDGESLRPMLGERFGLTAVISVHSCGALQHCYSSSL